MTSDIEILKRGNAGSKGSSNIIFPKLENRKIKEILSEIPQEWFVLGVRRNINLPIYLNNKKSIRKKRSRSKFMDLGTS